MKASRTRLFRCIECHELMAFREYPRSFYELLPCRSDLPISRGQHVHTPALVACPHCRAAFDLLGSQHELEFHLDEIWLSLGRYFRQPTQALLDHQATQRDLADCYQRVPSPASPTLAQCMQYAQMMEGTDLEWEYRLLTWHRLNDERLQHGPGPLTPAEAHNLRRLLHLSAGLSGDHLLKVEMLRQLGRFDEALEMLRPVLIQGLDERAEHFKAAIDRRDDQPFLIPADHAGAVV